GVGRGGGRRLRGRARRGAAQVRSLRARVRPGAPPPSRSIGAGGGRAPAESGAHFREGALGLRPDRREETKVVKEHFSEQLEDLRRNLILMGGEVERQIPRSIEALTEVDEKKAADVIAADAEIDRMEMVIEEQAVQLLALQQPVAVDLRFLVAALKINNDLERIGDHAVNIAEGAERLASQKPFKPFI